MKNRFKKAWKIYLRLLALISVGFWIYMIYDDWVFVEEYGMSASRIGMWFMAYLAFCILPLTFYYWLLVSLGIVIYTKFKNRKLPKEI